MAADLFVDGVAGKDTNAGTAGSPFQTIWKGWITAKPGDRVLLVPSMVYPGAWLGKNQGAAGAPITIRGAGPGLTTIHGKGSKDGIMIDGSSYVNFENLYLMATDAAHRSAHGIYIKESHHISVTDSKAKADCTGIQAQHSDWITISRNEVHDSSNRTLQQIWCSGISVHENKNFDNDTTSYKYVIDSNRVYGTLNIAEPGCTKCSNSDGSGIIIDDSRREQSDYVAYKGRHLVSNNVLFNNGGRGITSYLSDNVDIFNNTIWHNNQDPAEGAWKPGEITVEEGKNIRVMGNILVSDGLKPAHTNQHYGLSVVKVDGPVEVARNIFWNPQGDVQSMYSFRDIKPGGSVSIGDNDRFTDPRLTRPGKLPTAAFTLKSASPAKSLPAVKGTYPKADINGATRSPRSMTAGAYR